MDLVALVGYMAVLIAAFGGRTVLHMRRTGTSGWLAPSTTAARVGDALFTVGLAGLVGAAVLDLAGVLESAAALDRSAIDVAGLALLGAGGVVALVAQAQMGPAWRAGVEVAEDHGLVREGLFSVVRNPFYLGVLVASAGVALVAPSLLALAVWLVLLAGCEVEVRLVEEPLLRRTFGRAFADYTGSVPRFVPRLWRR